MAKSDKEIEKVTPSFEQLKGLNSFDDLAALAKELGGEVTPSSVLGDGFSLLEDKDYLIGKPAVFVTWQFSTGDYGDFVSARVMAQERNGTIGKYVINDGSTGIMEQLKQITTDNPKAVMISAPRGLRKSEYKKDVFDADVNDYVEKPATTYYIDTSSVA